MATSETVRREDFVTSVLAKCESLVQAGLWPGEPTIRPRGWLRNFSADEQVPAAAILDSFVFFSDLAVESLLKAAFESLLRTQRGPFATTAVSTAQASMKAFLQSAIVTRVEGEDPNPTDSGNLMCRKARQHLGIPESQIAEPSEALEAARHGSAIVFTDDFVGSGQQMLKTWGRQYSTSSPRSFAEAYRISPFAVSYVALVCTHTARRNLASLPITIHSAHCLDDRYAVPSCSAEGAARAFPGVADEMVQLLKKNSYRLKLPLYMTVKDFDVFGFHKLALALAFSHSVPDASLPVLWADGDDFTALVPRV